MRESVAGQQVEAVGAHANVATAPDAIGELHATYGNQHVQQLLANGAVGPGDAAALAALRKAASDYYIDGDEWTSLEPLLKPSRGKRGLVADALLEMSAFHDDDGQRNLALADAARDGIRSYLVDAGYRLPATGGHTAEQLPYLRGSNRQLSVPTTASVTKTLDAIRARGQLDAAAYRDQLQPLLWRLPPTDTPSTEAVVRLLGEAGVAMDDDVALALLRQVRTWGFPVALDAGRAGVLGQADAIIAAHIRSADPTFERLLALTEGPAGGGAGKGKGKGKQPTLIGVLDGGLDIRSTAVAGSVAANPREIAGNGRDDDGNGLVDDRFGYHFLAGSANLDVTSQVMGGGGYTDHGTAVLGIATADTTRIQAVMVGIDPDQVSACIDYAVARGARVINCSFALDKPAQAEAFRAAIARHPSVLFVQSAGNDDREMTALSPQMQAQHAPAANYLSVGAQAKGERSRQRDEAGRWFGSNWGAGHVDLAADATTFSATASDGYQSGAMTSQAAPAVTNVAAKVLTLAPELSAAQVRATIRVTVTASAEWEGKTSTGGVLAPERAMTLAAALHLVLGGMDVGAALQRVGVGEGEAAMYAGWIDAVKAS